jgi:RHS repeat-associated protein
VTAGPNNYTSVAGTSYTYDARKNLTSDGTRTFTYDSENRLLTASAPTAVTLSYDPLGRLQTSTASSTTTTFLYAGGFLAAEYSGSTVTQRYVPDPSGSEPVVWYQGSGTSTPQSIQTDELGSVIATSNTSGANSAIYGYGPNGEPGSGWTGSRYSYTGQIMIPEANVYYYKNRIYDPVIGRFLQTDPSGYAGGMNLYAYVANDPVNQTDPLGLEVGDLAGCPSAPDCSLSWLAANDCSLDDDGGCAPNSHVDGNDGAGNRYSFLLQVSVSAVIITGKWFNTYTPPLIDAGSWAQQIQLINLSYTTYQVSDVRDATKPQNKGNNPKPPIVCSASAATVAGSLTMWALEAGEIGVAGSRGGSVGARVGAIVGEFIDPAGGAIPGVVIGVVAGGVIGGGIFIFDQYNHGAVSKLIPGIHCP